MRLEVYIDGGSKGNPGNGIALVHVKRFKDSGEDDYYQYQILGTVTNNQAEYEALLLGMKEIHRILKQKDNVENVKIFTDSKLIEGQLTKKWKVNYNEQLVYNAMKKYEILKNTVTTSLSWVPRDKNLAGKDVRKINY